MDFNDTTPAEGDNEAFDALENLNAFASSVPAGDFVTLRHEANPPVYVAFAEGETTITLRAAIERRGWTLGSSVTAYLDNAQISMEAVLAPGSIVTLVGNVKGG